MVPHPRIAALFAPLPAERFTWRFAPAHLVLAAAALLPYAATSHPRFSVWRVLVAVLVTAMLAHVPTLAAWRGERLRRVVGRCFVLAWLNGILAAGVLLGITGELCIVAVGGLVWTLPYGAAFALPVAVVRRALDHETPCALPVCRAARAHDAVACHGLFAVAWGTVFGLGLEGLDLGVVVAGLVVLCVWSVAHGVRGSSFEAERRRTVEDLLSGRLLPLDVRRPQLVQDSAMDLETLPHLDPGGNRGLVVVECLSAPDGGAYRSAGLERAVGLI